MLILFDILFAIMIVCGITLIKHGKQRNKDDVLEVGGTILILGLIAFIITICATAYYTDVVISAPTLEERIAMYEAEGFSVTAIELKNKMLNMSTYRWWLYFGG